MNGSATTNINLTDLKHKLGIVSQDTQLFSGSIRDNLLFVAPNSSDEDINKVIQQASLTSMINDLENGIDTIIGEGGLKLS